MSGRSRACVSGSARKTLSIAIVIAMLVAFSAPLAAFAADPVVITATYGSFTAANIGSYQLNGSAALNGSFVRLTPPAGGQSGSMFWKQRVALDDNGSFSTQFSFRVSEPDSDGSDGFTFCLQPGTNTALSGGGGLGYDGVEDSLAVEFDTFQNSEYGDPSGNHVGIDLDGSMTSVATNGAPFPLQEGEVGYAWIEYDGTGQMLYVRVANTAARPTDALIEYGVDLGAHYGPAVYCGFTAATGGGYEAHDILGWYFTNEYVSAGLLPAIVNYSMGAAVIDAVADPDAVDKGAASDVTFTVKDAQGVVMSGQTLAITAPDGGSVSDDSVTTDVNGEATITFTAPDADQVCAVQATASTGLQGEARITVGEPPVPYYSSVTETIRASLDADGNQGVDDSEEYRGNRTPALSADGNFVTFYSGNVFTEEDTNDDRDWYIKNLESGAIELVSADDAGVAGEYGEQSSIGNDDGSAAISGDGRYVVFDSNSNTLDSSDSNDRTDVFIRDTVEGTTARVSENADGSDGFVENEGTAHYGSRGPVISRDGRYVAFYTGNAFVEEDVNDLQDWYRKDMTTGEFELVSVDSDENLVESVGGSDQDGGADRAAISSDGRYIAFDSWATDLVDNDTNGYRDVFLRDMTAGTTVPVSFDADEGNGEWDYGSRSPAISADGHYVVFISGNDYLEEDQNDNDTDWYLRDMIDGSVELVSVNMEGVAGNDGMWSNDGQAGISDDYRYISFVTQASDLTLGDTNDEPDVFVRDMEAGITGVVSVSSELEYSNGWQQNCSMSSDGMVVAYDSWADNLVADDTNGEGEYGGADIFVSYLEGDDTETEVVPIEGEDRYETAIEVSQKSFPEGADTVIIATGQNWPDALGGAALAGVVGGPVLLTYRTMLPSAVASEIERLGATNAYILGDYRALDAGVYAAVEDIVGADGVTRLGGINRYETAEFVGAEVVDLLGPDYDGVAFVATGLTFADALSASPLAAAQGWPVYLSGMPTISDQTLVAMEDAGVTDVVLLGGEAALSVTSAAAVKAAGFDSIRLDGNDRYETSVEVAGFGVAEAGLSWDGVAIATGQDFPDALSGGPLQGMSGSVMLLVQKNALPISIANALNDHAGVIDEVRFLGGLPAISAGVRADVIDALMP